SFKTAGMLALAFLCALVLSGLGYGLLGYSVWAFGVYLFLFVLLCLAMGWQEAIAMDSVLVSHFLSQGAFFPLLGNEVLLFVVGTGFGILVNLHLRSRREQFTLASDRVDGQIKEILGDLARWLAWEERSAGTGSNAVSCPIDCGENYFDILREALAQAEACAVANYGNAPFSRDTYELDYVRMRQQQAVILQAVYDNIRGITYLPRQAGQVAELLEQIRQGYHRYNNVEGLLGQMQALLKNMQTQALPRSREEFEARAVLFYILKQLEELLEVKRRFIRLRQPEKMYSG
ncbi:MAG: hypothetical protein K2H45_04690, partial [Acetatifactor sp.]|nr:hypothetical protein [Acetatifactor sp.]